MDQAARYAASERQPKAQPPLARVPEPITIGLNAAIFAVRDNEPVVAVIPAAQADRHGEGTLPCGVFSPRQHKTLEAGVRFLVEQQTGIELGLARQIGTLDDCPAIGIGPQSLGLAVVAVCYLALIGPSQFTERGGATWHSWYRYFPWEDWRHGKPACLSQVIEPRLEAWAGEVPVGGEATAPHTALDRRQRLRLAFGWDGAAWDEESVLERYDLLGEAGIIGQAPVDGATDQPYLRVPKLRHPLLGDQARVLAGAVGELRRNVKVRPVIFELMPDQFTLFELQKTVEAILGPHLHKQNFRRLVEGGGLVEPTGRLRSRTGGRPAQLYRFRRDVLGERLAPGVRIKAGRG